MRQSTDSNEFRRKRTLSKTLKASLISSSLSVSFIFRAIMVRNSGKSIVPLPTRTHRKEMTRPSNNQPLSGSMRCVPRVRRGLRRSQGLWTSPSASTSLIMSWSSASVGFCPSERMTVPSSLVVMVPSPSLSNSENASLNSGNGHRWRRQGRDDMSAERKPPPKGTSLHPHET